MRISEIDIDRFRIWRSLLLRLDVNGLNVIYGPNEAGKTTLMQFVRSVLYGFDPLEEEPVWHREESEVPWKGSLRCEHIGRMWRVSRRAAVSNRGRFRITGGPDDLSREESLDLLLGHTRENVFNDVFALGVRELQQLSTLGSDQVAEYIYGLSLGPHGRQLLTAIGDVRQRQAALLAQDGTQGRLPELFANYVQLTADDTRHDGESREKHATLTRQHSELRDKIGQLQARQSEIEAELRGLRFVSNCFKPWSRCQNLNKLLSDLPVIQHSPQDSLVQLSGCERDIEKHTAEEQKLTDQADQLRQQADRIKIDLQFEKSRYAIQSLVDQAAWLRQIDQQIHEAQERSRDLKRELDHQLREMGEAWNLERLNSVDTSPSSHHRLLQTARRYQSAAQRRSKLRRSCRGLSRRSQQELMELSSDLEAIQVESIPEAIELERCRLTELENLGRLRLQREQLALKIQTVRKVMSRVDTDDAIPPWVDRAVTGITAVSLALFFFGVVIWSQGVSGPSAVGGSLAASAFAFAGMMWWGIRNGMRNYFDRKTGIQLDDLNDEARQAEIRLTNVHDRIQRIQSQGITGQHLMKMDSGQSSTAHLVECIGECSRHITELERLSRRQERATRRRRRLAQLRERFRTAGQSLNEQRQEWCRLLHSLGMEETVKVQEAFDWWQRIQEVRELHTQWRNSAPEVEGLRRMFEGMGTRVRELGQQVGHDGQLDFGRPLEVLTAWQQQLTTHKRDRMERSRLTKEVDVRSQDATLARHQTEAAQLRRGAVFARSGVTNREELIQQAKWVQKREETEAQLKVATEELNDIAFADPELAIVEEDLSRFDPQSGRQAIQLLEAELEDLEKDLNSTHETVGSLKEQIQLLETSRGSQQQYFKRAQLASDIHRAAEEWYALQYEQDAVRKMRERFEKENISGTLRMASSYLHRMTSGRYHRIWAPLGKDFLCIDDEYNRTFRVEQLSGGTREQLFLAIRFALAREFADRGIELPMVMDDLFVNFDEERSEAALDCLLELAHSGQQILFFTCHQHLAERFRSRNVETLWLPGHRIGTDSNRPEDEKAAFMEDETRKNTRLDEPQSPLTGSRTPGERTVSVKDEDLNETQEIA
ncbi:MAG: AAA family ATPase [Fuerstiella sp.]|nr:AAA family ATPase [Fuerstiella sp.]